MGTKVHCKSFLPGFYSMGDLNEDANGGSWPVCYEDKSLKSGQYYNGISPRADIDGYLGYDKEVLKLVMLNHESIFRKQVYELHRLYRVQRDLMDEIRTKQLQKHPIPVETSQSILFSSQIPPGDVWKMSHIPGLPLVHSTCSRPSVSGVDNSQFPLSFIKGKSIQASPFPVRNGSITTDCELLESNCNKSQKRLFDLQLPASEYIDSEEGELFEEEKVSEVSEVASYPRKRNCEAAHESDVNLSIGCIMNPGYQIKASGSDFYAKNIHGLADLNEPVQVEEATTSASVEFLGHITRHGDIQQPDLSVKVNSGFQGWCQEFFQKTQNRRVGSCSNIEHSGTVGNRHEWQPYNFEAGKSRSNLSSILQASCPEKLSALSRQLQAESKKTQELTFPPFDPIKEVPRREGKNLLLEISERNHNLSSYNRLESVLASHSPLVHHSAVTRSEASSVSSWRKPTGDLSQNSIAVQALPCFSTSALLGKFSKTSVQRTELGGDKWYLGSNLRSNPSAGSEISYQNGFYHGSQSESKASQACFSSVGFDYTNCSNDSNSTSEQFSHHGPTKFVKSLDCTDMKSAKNMNLSLIPPRGFQNDVIGQQDFAFVDGQRKHENPSGGLPWLKLKQACNNEHANGNRGLTQMELVSLKDCPQQLANRIQTREGPSLSFVQDSTSTACSYDAGPKRINGGDYSNNRKFFGFFICDEPRISEDQSSSLALPSMSFCHASKAEDVENGGKSAVLGIDLARHLISHNSEKHLTIENLVAAKKGLDSNVSVSRNNINLNSCINEEECLSTPFIPRAVMKIAIQIDLEAPVVLETEEVTHGEQAQENQLETYLRPSHVAGDSDVELVRNAAQAIITISLFGVHNRSDDPTSHPSEASLRDSLCWFADAISCYTSYSESEFGAVFSNKDGGGHEESSSDGLDYFEFMTLKLTETKVEEYCCETQAVETTKEEETGSILLPGRRRKGQGRRGRQRRDFQRDILPGLASLSRHEVTEDLQTIEGLMKATGHTWETGLARRNGTRKRGARGRQRSGGSASISVATAVCPSPRQWLTKSKVGLEETNLTGWGKTTRRPRRQRCPAVIPPLLLPSQVYEGREREALVL